MAISYKPFIDYIEKKGLTVNSLFELGIYSDSAAKSIRKGEPVNLKHIDAICQFLDLPIEKVIYIELDKVKD